MADNLTAPLSPAPDLRHWPGDPDRPAIAVHGILSGATVWGPIASHLGGRIDLLAPDLPGHGKAAPWHPGEIDYHTAATRKVAELIQRPVDLIGHSLGGTIALRIAIAAPDAIRSLTLIEPVFFAAAAQPHLPLFDEIAALLDAGDNHAAAARFIEYWGGMPLDRLPKYAQIRLAEQIALLPATQGTLADDTNNLLRPDGLEAIDAPVLFISGETSPPIVHDIAAALSERLPDVGRATIPGAGHMSPLSHPAEVAGLIAVNLDRA